VDVGGWYITRSTIALGFVPVWILGIDNLQKTEKLNGLSRIVLASRIACLSFSSNLILTFSSVKPL